MNAAIWLITILFVVGAFACTSWVFHWLWCFALVPLGVPAITWGQGAGILLLVSIVSSGFRVVLKKD